MRYGAGIDPPNRFEKVRREAQLDDVAWDQEFLDERDRPPVQYILDQSQSIVTENQSPDIPFRYSVNPYRGCVHGCSYCYARHWHEFLGFNAGRDFETKIIVKPQAPALLRDFLLKPSYQPEPITFSGITDCYQPCEREFRLTRQCLEVAEEFSQPISIVTKNALVVRDRDLLGRLAARQLATVNISVTTLDPELARVMEPRTSIPAARLRAVRELTDAGVPVRVLFAPVIPGLNDHEMAAVLKAAKEAGAQDARYNLLRLPLSVQPVFMEWLERHQKDAASKIGGRIRHARKGRWTDVDFATRMTGTGVIADQIGQLFRVLHQKHGFADIPSQRCDLFCRPKTDKPVQLSLFDLAGE